MKLEDFETVQELNKVRKTVEEQITHVTTIVGTYKKETCDSNNENTQEGAHSLIAKEVYSLHLAKHRDGSGLGADLTGCYVGLAVYEAVLKILEEKLVAVNKALSELGVEV